MSFAVFQVHASLVVLHTAPSLKGIFFRLIRQIFTFNIFSRSVEKLKIFLRQMAAKNAFRVKPVLYLNLFLFGRELATTKKNFSWLSTPISERLFSAFLFQSYSIRLQGWINIATAAAFLTPLVTIQSDKRQLIVIERCAKTHSCSSSKAGIALRWKLWIFPPTS